MTKFGGTTTVRADRSDDDDGNGDDGDDVDDTDDAATDCRRGYSGYSCCDVGTSSGSFLSPYVMRFYLDAAVVGSHGAAWDWS